VQVPARLAGAAGDPGLCRSQPDDFCAPIVRTAIDRLTIYTGVVPESPGLPSAGQPLAGHRSPEGTLITFERYAGPATLILSSLADGPKHGYALTKDIEQFAGVRLAPGTLYEALSRLESQGFIEALPSEQRRRPYQLTAAGAQALRAHLADQRRVADVGLRRLAHGWGPA
jgi:DNA-binding PadR family transcriptional regulator